MINNELQKYIEDNILPLYEKNDPGHGIIHIMGVIKRSLKFASTIKDINYDMVYTVAAYHDLGHHIDPLNHEKKSAFILLHDEHLREYFSYDQIRMMAEAVYDHRASSNYEPRSIYGKIVSSADRNVTIESVLKRAYEYRKEHDKNDGLDRMIEISREHLMKKYGKNGYAVGKMYFEDPEYLVFLENVSNLVDNKEKFEEKFIEVNNIERKRII